MSSGKKSKTTGSPPRNETPEQRALRRLREFRSVRKQYSEKLATWKKQTEDILAELRPAYDRAQRSHAAVMALDEKIKRKEMEVLLLADSTSEVYRRRMQGRPEDEYHDTVSAAEKKRDEEEKKKRRNRLKREVEEMKRLYASYESQDQADAKEYTKLEREYDAAKGHIAKVQRDVEEIDRDIEELERQLQFQQQAQGEQHGRDRHRRHDDRGPRDPPPGGSGRGSTGVWDQYVASKHGRGGGYSGQAYGSGGGGGGGGGGGYGYRYGY